MTAGKLNEKSVIPFESKPTTLRDAVKHVESFQLIPNASRILSRTGLLEVSKRVNYRALEFRARFYEFFNKFRFSDELTKTGFRRLDLPWKEKQKEVLIGAGAEWFEKEHVLGSVRHGFNENLIQVYSTLDLHPETDKLVERVGFFQSRLTPYELVLSLKPGLSGVNIEELRKALNQRGYSLTFHPDNSNYYLAYHGLKRVVQESVRNWPPPEGLHVGHLNDYAANKTGRALHLGDSVFNLNQISIVDQSHVESLLKILGVYEGEVVPQAPKTHGERVKAWISHVSGKQENQGIPSKKRFLLPK